MGVALSSIRWGGPESSGNLLLQRATLAEGHSCRGPLLRRATLAEGHSCGGPLLRRATLAEGHSCRGPLLQRATLAEGHSCRGPLLLRSDGPPQEWVVDARMKFLHTRTESIHVVNTVRPRRITVRPRRITVRPRRITVRPRREHSPFTSHHSPSTREQGRPTREQGRSSSRESGVRVWPQRAIGPPQEWALSYLLFTAPVPFLSRRSFSRRLALTASVPHRSQFLVGSMRPMRRLRRFATVLGFHCFRLSRPPARPVPG